MRNEYRVESQRGSVMYVKAENTLDAIQRAGFTPETTYTVEIERTVVEDIDGHDVTVDRYTRVWW